MSRTETVNTILNHRSIRKYKNEVINENDILTIIDAAQMAPSSVNGQSRSLIEVRDPEVKAEIIAIASQMKRQQWIADASHFFILCMDFRRAVFAAEKNGKENLMVNQTEALMIGAVDAGLAMGNAIAVAESMGYGAIPIGAIRNDPGRVVELLDLPEYVYPLNGFVVGVKAEESAVKPRLPREAFYHVDGYKSDDEMKALIDAYDETMSAYMSERTEGASSRNWSETTAGAFSTIKHPDITKVLKGQGFRLL